MRHPLPKQLGTAIIELALLLVMLLLVTVGITEVGRSFWYFSAAQKAAREGARCLSYVAWDATGAPNVGHCLDIVVADANSASIQPPVTLANVEIACDGAACGTWGNGSAPEYVGVRISHSMTWLWEVVDSLPAPKSSVPYQAYATMPLMN